MKLKDARHMSASAQEALRYRVVNAIENGMSKSEASRVFKVSRTAIHNWTKATAIAGSKALKAKKRGPQSSSRLLPHQAATAVRKSGVAVPRSIRFTVLLMDTRVQCNNFSSDASAYQYQCGRLDGI